MILKKHDIMGVFPGHIDNFRTGYSMQHQITTASDNNKNALIVQKRRQENNDGCGENFSILSIKRN